LLIGDNFHTMTGLTVSAVESGNANGVYDHRARGYGLQRPLRLPHRPLVPH
jgi:hypothetical protein